MPPRPQTTGGQRGRMPPLKIKKTDSALFLQSLFLAAESGFEPEQNESESFVLPLHNSAMNGADNQT